MCGCRDAHSSKDALSCKLAVDYGITAKSVRDIWNMRTWGWATIPYWTEDDKRRFVDSRLCAACRRRGVLTAETACDRCAVRCTVTRRRGRPPGIKETKPRKRSAAMHTEEGKGPRSAAIPGFPPNFPGGMGAGSMANPQMVFLPPHSLPPQHPMYLQHGMFSPPLGLLNGGQAEELSPAHAGTHFSFHPHYQLQHQYMQQLMQQQHMQQQGLLLSTDLPQQHGFLAGAGGAAESGPYGHQLSAGSSPPQEPTQPLTQPLALPV